MDDQNPAQGPKTRVRRVKKRTKLAGNTAGLSRRTILILAAVLGSLALLLVVTVLVLNRAGPSQSHTVQEASAEQRASADTWAWHLAQEQGSLDALNSYLKLFPQGRYAEQARAQQRNLLADGKVDGASPADKSITDANRELSKADGEGAPTKESEASRAPSAKSKSKDRAVDASKPQPSAARARKPSLVASPKDGANKYAVPRWLGVDGPQDWRQATYQHKYGVAKPLTTDKPDVAQDTPGLVIVLPEVAIEYAETATGPVPGSAAEAIPSEATAPSEDMAAVSESAELVDASQDEALINRAPITTALADADAGAGAPEDASRVNQEIIKAALSEALDSPKSESSEQASSAAAIALDEEPALTENEASPLDFSSAPLTQQALELPGGSMSFIVLPEGQFTMGSADKSASAMESPQRTVSVASFALARSEVSFAHYDAFVEATGYRRPSAGDWGRGEQAVIDVSWDDVQAYINWLNEAYGGGFRLPSEAEWEYAVRAGTSTRFSVGNCLNFEQANFAVTSKYQGCMRPSGEAAARPQPPGRYAANPWGLFDMHGNVWEWLADCWHRDYRGAPATSRPWLDSEGGKCNARVIRGGSWRSALSYLRSSARYVEPAYRRNDSLGFRLARDLKVE